VAQKKRRLKVVVIVLIFVVYFFIAARPVPKETVLASRWISSLPENSLFDNADANDSPQVLSGLLVPFTLSNRFGYVDSLGQFAIEKPKNSDIYLSKNMWTEYGAEPERIIINNIVNETQTLINNARGYPILLDNRIFILGSEQNSLSEFDAAGNLKWIYEFGAPLTAIDAASGLVLTGSLDGVVELFNSDGDRIFYFEPTGSRFSVILGCAISRNGSYIGIICGIDQQRFLLFERFGMSGGEYRIVYHEFLETGFRRPVRILFLDDDRRVIFERENGIGCYSIKSKSIKSRRSIFIPLEGEITAIDELGDNSFFFLVTSSPFNNNDKKLIGIKFPPEKLFGLTRNAAKDAVFMKAPFKSDDAFLYRSKSGSQSESTIIAGGGTVLISFNLEEK